jgi:hypothetical protein
MPVLGGTGKARLTIARIVWAEKKAWLPAVMQREAAVAGGEQEADKSVCCTVHACYNQDRTVAKISEALTELIMCGYIRPKVCKPSQSWSFKKSANKLVLTYSRWPQAEHKCECFVDVDGYYRREKIIVLHVGWSQSCSWTKELANQESA